MSDYRNDGAKKVSADAGWSLYVETRCSRRTIWHFLSQETFWQEVWGPCCVEIQSNGRFEDKTGDVMPLSCGRFLQVIPFHQIDLLWYLGRSESNPPSQFSTENSMHLRLKIDTVAASVQRVEVTIVAINDYPPRGKWVALSKRKWAAFLDTLRHRSETETVL